MEYFQDNLTPHLEVFSPGRINLIGEHTDYNMGYVLPVAIDKGISFSFWKNESEDICNIESKNFNPSISVNLAKITKSSIAWQNYLLGVLYQINLKTNRLKGFNCIIESNLPVGAGVSSSAALECGLAFGLNELFDLGMSKLEMVKLSQSAEHHFVGSQCGIMDQFASVMSIKNHFLLLDCSNLEYQHIPIHMDSYKIIMLNTKVSHNLAESEYNTRKQECEQGVAIISKSFPEINTLRDVSFEMLKECKKAIPPLIYKRCLFIIEENQRVLETVKALQNNDLVRVGSLLYEGHHGISRKYEVSCPESDFLVAFSKGNRFVLGARQTGGGFGGCTLNLVHKEGIKEFIRDASAVYFDEFNIHLEAFEALPSEGTTIIKTKIK